MNKNVGSLDRGIRILLGIIVLSLYFVVEGNLRWWALIGFVPLMTGLIGWCPAYVPFGIKTCGMRRG